MKKIITTLLILTFLQNMYSQNEDLREINYLSIEPLFGLSDNGGPAFQFNYAIPLSYKKPISLDFGFHYDNNDIKVKGFNFNVPSEVVLMFLGYNKKVNFLSSDIYLFTTRFSIGPSVGVEEINNESTELPNGEFIEKVPEDIFGGYLAISTSFKISKPLAVVIRSSHFFTSSEISSYKFFVGLGLAAHLH